MSDLLRRFDLQFFADDGDDGDPNAGGTGGNEPQDPADGKQDPSKQEPTPKLEEKTFTQTDVDSIIQKRLARERKQWETQLEEEKKKAAMTEAERLKAEKEEAEKKAQDAMRTANERLVRAEVKQLCVDLNIVDSDAAYALMDRENVEVKEDGSIAGVKEALEKLVDAKPWMKGTQKKPGVGGDSNPGDDKATTVYTREKLAKMSTEEINEHWDKIQSQLRQGLIK